MKYTKELQKLKSAFPEGLWTALAEHGCIIAGGAITSVFTNAEINDYDIYFRSKEDFTKIFKEVYREYEYGGNGYGDLEYDLTYSDGIAAIVTKKALLLFQGNAKIQFIVNAFYETPEDIFDHFDFTCCMGALRMQDETFVLHEDFLKHNAQKYLSFNPGTLYPLVSALRANKYKDRGYTISKSQMLRILLAVNAKEIDTWEVLMDEMGGMYGTPPEEIFDIAKEFSLELAMEQLENVNITEKMQPNCCMGAKEIAKVIRHAFTDEYLEKHGIPKEEPKPLPAKQLDDDFPL